MDSFHLSKERFSKERSSGQDVNILRIGRELSILFLLFFIFLFLQSMISLVIGISDGNFSNESFIDMLIYIFLIFASLYILGNKYTSIIPQLINVDHNKIIFQNIPGMAEGLIRKTLSLQKTEFLVEFRNPIMNASLHRYIFWSSLWVHENAGNNIKKISYKNREEKQKVMEFKNCYYSNKSGETLLLSDLLTEYVGVKKSDEFVARKNISVREIVNNPFKYLHKAKSGYLYLRKKQRER